MGKKSAQTAVPGQTGAEALKNTCRNLVSSITGIYVFLMLTAFPLFVTDKYFEILDDKFYLFWVGTAVAAGASLAAAIACAFIDCREFGGENVKAFFGMFRPSEIRKHLLLPDYFMLLFMLVSILSTIFSEWQYEAFWGNMGRLQGLFMWIWYAAAYVLVTRFFQFRRYHMDAYLLIGVVVAVWGVMDYFGLDPLGWQAAIPEYNSAIIFSSSIGNVNTLTAVVGLYLSAASVMFVCESTQTQKGKIRLCFYYFAVLCCFACMIAGQSDNAVLAAAALLCFLPFFAWRTRNGILRYLLIVLALFAACCFIGTATAVYDGKIIPEWAWGVLLHFSNGYRATAYTAFAAVLLLAVAFFGMCRAVQLRKKDMQTFSSYMEQPISAAPRLVWLSLGILGFVVLTWLFYDANHGGHPQWYAPLSNLFYFNADWGTHRGFNWSLLMGHFKEFPLWKKLIGAGPETYGIFTGKYDYYIMMDAYGETYDSPHNEFLQYLFSTGILGFIGYYGAVVSGCLQMFGVRFDNWKNRKANGIAQGTSKSVQTCAAAAFGFGVITYTVQSFINISAPIVVPTVLLFLAMGIAVSKGNQTDECKGKTR